MVSINGKKPRKVKLKTGRYRDAALAAVIILDHFVTEEETIVKIWCEDVLPDYGPYYYVITN